MRRLRHIGQDNLFRRRHAHGAYEFAVGISARRLSPATRPLDIRRMHNRSESGECFRTQGSAFAQAQSKSNPDGDAGLFEMTMSILEEAGYEQDEISNYARPGFSSVHNRAYWSGEDYLGIGPSAFSTVAMRRWQNLADYRAYADRVLSRQPPIGSTENLTSEMKQAERIALSLRTREEI